MLNIYKTIGDSLYTLDKIEDNAWINLTNPTEDELDYIVEKLNVERDFLNAALDEEESARVDTEKEQILILVDTPAVEKTDEHIIYETLPLGIILTENNIVTVCLKDSIVLDQFEKNSVRTFSTNKKFRFIYQILYRNAQRYLLYLRQIDKMSNQVEKKLHKSMKNKELIQLLDLEKSLVYITTALKANEAVLEKILKLDIIKKFPDDKDLLDDVIVENKQAIEMANIYSGILSGMMDAFASIISNNLNIVMKVLASITIIMSIPTIFASFYGMNVINIPFSESPYGFYIVIGMSAIISLIAGLIFMKKNLF